MNHVTQIVIGMAIVQLAAFSYWMYIIFRDLKRERNEAPYRTAAHEAGHTIVALAAEGARPLVKVVTIVPGEDHNGRVTYSLSTSDPDMLDLENLIVMMAGAAGEFMARELVNTEGCRLDFVKAVEAAAAISIQLNDADIKFDVQPFFKNELPANILRVLNYGFSEAYDRIMVNDQKFFRLVGLLLDRRELTGSQVNRLVWNNQ